MDPKADKVLGMLEKMKLSEDEKKSVKIGGDMVGSVAGRIRRLWERFLRRNQLGRRR